MSADGTPDCLEGLEAVEWDKLEHAYGPASDVPAALLALTTTDDQARAAGWKCLRESLLNSGSIFNSTGAALPFLTRMLADERTPHREALLSYFGTAAETVVNRQLKFLSFPPDPEAVRDPASFHGALKQVIDLCVRPLNDARPMLIALLAHGEPEIRLGAVSALSWLVRLDSSPVAEALRDESLPAVLRSRIDTEQVPLTQVRMIAAFARACAPVPELRGVLRRWLQPPFSHGAGLAAVRALLEAGEPPDGLMVQALVDGLTHWDAYRDEQEEPDDEGSQKRRTDPWYELAGALRGLVHFGALWYDPTRPLPEVCGAWQPFPSAPRYLSWFKVVDDPGLPASPLGRTAIERLRHWRLDPDPLVRLRASHLLLANGYGGPGEADAIRSVLAVSEPLPHLAALESILPLGLGTMDAELIWGHLEPALEAVFRVPAGTRARTKAVDYAETILRRVGNLSAPPRTVVERLLNLLETGEEPRLIQVAASELHRAALTPDLADRVLELLADHHSPGTRCAAAGLTRKLPAASIERAVVLLAERIGTDECIEVRTAFIRSLLWLRPEAHRAAGSIRDPLEEMLANTAPWTWEQVTKDVNVSCLALLLIAFGHLAPPDEVLPVLLAEFERGRIPPEGYFGALSALGPNAAPAVPALIERLVGADAQTARMIIDAIERTEVRSEEVLSVLAPWATKNLNATHALRRMGAPCELWLPALRAHARRAAQPEQIESAELLWKEELDIELAHQCILAGLKSRSERTVRAAALALIPMGISAMDAAPLLWEKIENAFNARTRELAGMPFGWVTEVTIASAAALWGMGMRSQVSLDLLAYGLHSKHRRHALEAVRRLGPHARPLIPTLRALIDTRPARDPSLSGHSQAKKLLSVLEGCESSP